MRLTNAEIVQYFRDITEIINRREKYPVRFSFALLKNYRALEPENRNIEEARNRLLDEYNRKDSEGKPLYLDNRPDRYPAGTPEGMGERNERASGH